MSFGAPLFLLAALAGLIPVLLHMINRQKAPQLPFATLRFLRQAVERTRRRKRIHDAALMSLRVAGLVLLAVALARPAISRVHRLLGGSAAAAMAIVLDNSASMAIDQQEGPRWQAALEAVERLLDLAGPGDQVALLPACGPPLPQAARLYSDQQAVRQALGVVKLSSEQADLAARLREAARLLRQSDAPNREIYVVTDRQAVCWERLRPAGADDPQPIPVVLIDVRGQAKPNAGLISVQLHCAAPVAGAPVQAAVEIRGDPQVRQQRRVELYVDDALQQTSPELTIDPNGTVKHVFQFAVDQAGLHRGELRLAGQDASPLDDRLCFALEINPQIQVGVIRPRIHEIPYLDDAFYLLRALAPGDQQQWAIHAVSLPPDELAEQSLSQFAVIYCLNLPRLSDQAARRLADYVAGGGRLVWACGDQLDPVAYGLMNDRTEGRLLPARLGPIRRAGDDQPEGWNISWIDDRHPALAPFAQPASLYQSVIVRAHATLSPAKDARVLARLDDGQPLLVERSVGSGAVLLWGSSFHRRWTNFPLRPLFLPLVVRLTFHLADAHAAQAQLPAGSPIVVPLAATTQAVELTRPDGVLVRAPAEGKSEYRYPDTHDPGLYTVRLVDPTRNRRMAFAVNLAPQETDPAALDAEQLARRLAPQPLITCQGPADLEETVRRLRQGESLWGWFLTAVLAALVLEAFVANRVAEQPGAGAIGSGQQVRSAN